MGSMEAFDYLNAYYSNYDEEGRLLSKHGQVEYLTTMRYIRRYLQSGMRGWRLAQAQAGIPTHLPDWASKSTRWN